ncbi:TPA: C-terminal binding protein [bacterium]|nr:C-terminal binding protein [bacterium]
MPKFKVIVTDYVFTNFDIEKSLLSDCDAELFVYQCKSVEELTPLAVDADVILNTYLGYLDDEFMSSLNKCKAIIRYGIGIDTIDVDSATKHGIMVANVPDYCIEEVSDHAVACLLALIRKITISDRYVRKGNWNLGYLKPLHRIKDLTIGIVGMGRIGRLSASKLMPFGTKLIFFDPYVKDSISCEYYNAEKVSLEELVSISDAILIHAPSNKETYHLFNKELFFQMKRKPLIINCARGSLIKTDDLVDALTNNKISGVALDVIEDVPPFDINHPLCQFDNVIITPHSAWYSEESILNLQRLATEEAVRVLKGERPKSLVNPDVIKVE